MRRLFTWKRLAVAAVAVPVLAAVAAMGFVVVNGLLGQATLSSTLKRLDRDEPGWRLVDIVRATNAKLPPDDRNPFILATAANDLLPKDFAKRFADFPDWSKSGPNVMLDPAARAKLLAASRGMEPATDLARDLADLPDPGGNVIVVLTNPTFRLMQKEQDLRLIATLLRADAVLLAEDGKADEAVRSARAALGVARAVGDDPGLIGQLLRCAVGSVAGRAAESVVNLGEPNRGLAELQAELLKETDAPRLLVALRGERACAEDATVATVLPRLFSRSDRACSIEVFGRYLEAADTPLETRAAALRSVALPTPGDPRHALTSLMIPALEKVATATIRTHGELSAVAVGIACERHRRRFGRWPATLADIPGDILAAVPTDPGDGTPIKYRRLADRVVVYSVGPDGVDHGGDLSEATPKDRRDWGIRIYDVSHRRRLAPATPGDVP